MAETQAPAAKAPPAEQKFGIDEFCARLSRTDKRVELLAGFAHSEKAAARTRDTQTAYAARYEAFAGAPVGKPAAKPSK